MQNGGSYVEKESGRGGKVEWARWKVRVGDVDKGE